MSNPLVKNEYYLGLDLGRRQDFSALVIIERCVKAINTRFIDANTEWREQVSVRYAKRWKLGTAYGSVAQEISDIYRKVEREGPALLIVDQTGVGDAVFEMIRGHLRGANLEGVIINQEIKRDLYAALEAGLETGRIRIANDCHAARELKQELLSVEIRRVGFGFKFGAFDKGAHDDLVMAMALACWRERQGGLAPRGVNRLPGF
jgi:phage FluMu gp28-like protein